MRWLPISIAAAALVACSPRGNAEPAAGSPDATMAAAGQDAEFHPVSGLEVADLKVVTGGKTHDFRVEMARTSAEQARGLMFRTQMGPDEGMLFPSAAPEPRSFWMKNTPLSLDIIFIGSDRRITNIAANTEPYSLTPVTSTGFAIAVLELNGGRAAELGIEAGDEVIWTAGE